MNLGSKVLAAVSGGSIRLYGQRVAQRWTRLAADAPAGASEITVAGAVGWTVGQRVLVTSSSYNWRQAEIQTIAATAVAANGADTLLTLAQPLAHNHTAKVVSYNGGAQVLDMRAEVAMIDSNVRIEAPDGPYQHTDGVGSKFGPRVIGHGSSVAELNNIAMAYCGQAGLRRPCVMFKDLQPVAAAAATNTTSGSADGLVPNPSALNESAITFGLERGLYISSPSMAVTAHGNVFYESFEQHGVQVWWR